RRGTTFRRSHRPPLVRYRDDVPKLGPTHDTRRFPARQPERDARMRYRCAVLDDYQNVALKSADWSKIAADVDVTVFNQHLGGPDEVQRALTDFHIISMMRERTPFRRNTIEALPNLKLLITTGARNASIDMAAAAERGITVCSTSSFGNPTTGIT